MSTSRLASLAATVFLCGAVALPSIARADTDACTLLTPAQVAATVGAAARSR